MVRASWSLDIGKTPDFLVFCWERVSRTEAVKSTWSLVYPTHNSSWPGLSRPSRLGKRDARLIGMAGTSPAMTARFFQASSTLFFERRGYAFAEAPADKRAAVFHTPRKYRGERSAGRRTISSPRWVARGVPCEGTPRLPALHCGAYHSHTANGSASGPRFLGRGLLRPVPVQQAPCRAVVMPPGRVPRPLECVVTSHTREDRSLLHPPNVSGRRPSMSKDWGKVAGECGKNRNNNII